MTAPSLGSWLYGFWNPDVGFGFANPENHFAAIETEINSDENRLRGYELLQNYPNPFNPKTTISFYLPFFENVKLLIFDLQGREVKVLVDNAVAAGLHFVGFDASDISSGIYFYSFTAGNFAGTRKFTIVR